EVGSEVQTPGELEVAAAVVAGSAAHSSKVAAINVHADAAERDFVCYVLAIRAEHELPSLGDVEGAAHARVQIIDARIAQAIERQYTWRIAEHEVLHIAERAGAAGARRRIRARILICTADIAIQVGDRTKGFCGDSFAPTAVLADGLARKTRIEVRHASSGERLKTAGASRRSKQQGSAGSIREDTRKIPAFDDLACDWIT